jgi:hypothetical protein
MYSYGPTELSWVSCFFMPFHAFSCFFRSDGCLTRQMLVSGLERCVSTRGRLGSAEWEKSRCETFRGRLRPLGRRAASDCSRPKQRAGGQGDATQNPYKIRGKRTTPRAFALGVVRQPVWRGVRSKSERLPGRVGKVHLCTSPPQNRACDLHRTRLKQLFTTP